EPEPERDERTEGRAELRQQAREEDGHLRVSEVREQALPERAPRRAAAARPRLDVAATEQRLEPEVDEVRRASKPDGRERGLRGAQERDDAGARRERPRRLPRGDPGRRADAGPAAAEE